MITRINKVETWQRTLLLLTILACLGMSESVHANIIEALKTTRGADRIRVVQGAPDQWFSEEEAAALIEWINQPEQYIEGSPDSQNYFYNELLEALRHIEAVPSERMAAALGICILDDSRVRVQRDYAMQHLGHLYLEGMLSREALEPLFEMVENGEDQLAATALVTLERLVDGGKLAAEERLKVAVLSALEHTGKSAFTRAAVHAAAKFHLLESLPHIRSLILDPACSPNIQMVGFYALGKMGSAEDLVLLRNWQSPNPRCQFALQAAIDNLTNR